MHLPPSTPAGPATPAACLAALICENAILARQLAALQERSTQTPAPIQAAPGPAEPTPTDRPRRRKLHDLPSHAQDLLLALSFTPATLRTDIEKALSRMRGQPVQLLGSEADVLYSALHDLGQRNVLSEALHRRLEARHSVAVRRLAPLRDGESLRQAWLAALQTAVRPQEDIPAVLWALLTHPQGAAQQVRALAEARTWVLAQARRGQAATERTDARRLQALQAEVEQLKLRLHQRENAHAQELQQLRLMAARQAGEARRNQPTETNAAQDWRPVSAPRPSIRPSPKPLPRPSQPPRPQVAALADRPATAATDEGAAAGTSPVQGRRVLCVGGIQHAVARYRSRIETLGGRFEHHDGGIHDNAHALDGRLQRADLVICQAGCINHAAYHRIKQHCQRTGTPCLYLERASLSRFDRALQGLQAPAERPAEHPRP